MPDKIDLLFDDLQSRGYAKDKTRKQFRDYMLAPGKQGYENRRTFFEDFKSNGETSLGSYEDFKGLLGLHATKKQQSAPSVYQKAQGGGGLGRAMKSVSAKVQQSRAVGQPQAKVEQPIQPTTTPTGLWDLDMNAKATPAFMKGQEEAPQQQPDGFKETLKRAATGQATPEEAKQTQKRLQQRMDELEYEEKTGKQLRDTGKYFSFEAPTVARDENGEMVLGDNGQPIIGRTTDEAKAEAHQQVAEDQERLNIEKQLEEAYAEKERIESFLNNDEESLRATENLIMSGGYDPTMSAGTEKVLENRNAYYNALRQIDRQIKELEAAKDNAGFGRGVLNTLIDPSAYSFGLTDIDDAKQLNKIKEKIEEAAENGVEPNLTDGEKAFVDSYLKNEEAQQVNKNNWWYDTAGKGLGQTINFIKDFALTGGGFAKVAKAGMKMGAKGGAKLASKVLGDYMKKNLGTKALGKTIEYLGKGAGLAAGAEASGFLLNNTAQAASSAADIMNRYTGNLTYDKDGNLTFEGGKSLGEAILTSQIARTGQNASELVGIAFDAMPGILGRVIQRTTAGKVLKRITDSKFWKKGENALDYLGIQSVWGEGFEEEYGMARDEILNRLTNNAYMPEGSGLFDSEQQLETWKAVGLTSMILRLPSMIVSGTQTANYYANKYNLNASDRQMRSTFGDEARYQAVKTVLDEADNKDISKVLNNILNDNDLSQEEKQSAFIYANDLIKMRGFNIGSVVAAANGYQAPPRVAGYNIKGNTVEEVDENGNVLETHEYGSREEMKAGLFGLQQERYDKNLQSDISVMKTRPGGQYGAMVEQYCKETGIDVEEFEEMLNKPSMERTDAEQQIVTPFAELLHSAVYDNTTLHEEQSQQDGEETADADSIDIEDGSEQGAVIGSEWAAAQENRQRLFEKNEELKQEVELMESQGLSHQEIISRLETFSPEDVQSLIDYYNTEAKFNGYINRKSQKIDEEAAYLRDSHTFKGTINGQADVQNVHKITDGVNEYYLVSGNVTTDSSGKITGSTSGLIIGMDLDGSFVQLNDADGYSVMPVEQTLDQYEEAERIRLQQQVTSVIDPEGRLRPEASPQPSPVGREPRETTGAQPAVEAGQEQTGADEAAGETPAEQPTPNPSVEGNRAVEVPTDDNGVKLYEQGTPIDDAIADIQKDGYDPVQYADLAISEAKEELGKMKEPKTRADLVRNNARSKELQNTIDYYNALKEKVAATTSQQREQESVMEASESEENVNIVDEGNTVDEKELSLQEQIASGDFKGRTADDRRRSRIEALKSFYGDLFDADFSYAKTAMELASMAIGRNRMLSRESLEKELGYPLGLGTGESWAETLLAKKGEGKTVKELAHDAWEGPENPMIDGEHKFDVDEIYNAILDLFRAAGSKSDVIDYPINSREEAAKRTLEARQRESETDDGTFVPFTAEEIEAMEANLPFAAPVEGEDIPDSTITLLTKAVQELQEQEGTPEIKLVDTDRMTNDEWYDIASGVFGGAFVSQEDIDKVRDTVLADGLYVVDDTGAITVYSDSQTPEELKYKVEYIKNENNGRSNEEKVGELEAEDVQRPSEGASGVERTEVETAEGEVTPTATRPEGQEKEPADKAATTSQQGEQEEYLQPRNEKEEKIVNDVLEQLQQEIGDAVKERDEAASALEKARTEESDKATDIFSDDNTFNEEGQLFDSSDMPTDRSQEGVNKRTSAERERLNEAQAKLNKLQSEAERNSRVRGALDEERKQTEIKEATSTPSEEKNVSTNPIEAIENAATEFRKEQKENEPSLEDIKEASGVEETEEKAKDNPSGNKIVTDARYEELKKRMRDKLLGQMNVGVDPEILAIGVEMAVYHIEKGARKFADYARGMIEDLGDVIRPYLKAFYNGARDLPEMTELSKEMDDYQTVQSFDVANFDKRTADPVEQAKEIADEDKVEKDVPKAKENIKIVAKENKKKKKNISSQQEAAKQQPDLFNLNTEENEQEVRRDEGLPAEQGSRSESEGQEGGEPERVREGGSSEPNRPLQSGLSNTVEEAEAEPQPAEKKNQRNNRNERGKDYAPTSPVARVKANIAAIKLLKALETQGRDATPEEMDVLKQYSGWGGLGGAFNENSPYYNEVRDVLDDAEYDSAAMSINSAYYTPASIIDRLWDVAAKLGFKGGKILESSAGIGNIIASIPEDMNERSDIEMVEIDSISGRILEKLYPDAKVSVKGFEDTRIENGSVDLAITNVPFVTGLKVRDEVDTDLSRQFGNIHDFVIAKNIRKLKEGGIGIFITTSNTLDKSDALREWIDSKGDTDVMGVFRLNNETFGGTNVTSDIIVVRKRVNGERHPDAINVMQSSVVRDGEYDDLSGRYDWRTGTYDKKHTSMRVNNYLNEHPENMGGEMAFNYEKGETFRPGGYGLYPSEKSQEQLLDAWVQKMKDVFAAATTSQRAEQEDTTVREGRMFIKDGKIYVSQQGKAVPYSAKKAKVKGKSVEECVKDYVAIRESLSDVLKYQLENESDENLKPLLDKLNKAYDDFVKKYGYLHKNTAISFLRDDIEFPDIAALENYSETKDIEGNKIVRVGKSKVFDGRVLRFKTEPKPQNVKDGVLASVQQFGKIDLGWLASVLPNQTENSIKAEILNSGYGFEDPVTKKVEVRYEYLSGNVREKLRQARENNTDGRYNKNIEALEKVLPMDIPAHLIDFSLGSSWIDPKLYEDFVKDRYGCTVNFVNAGGVWSMEVLRGEYDEKNRAGGVHSKLLGDTIPASKLVEAAINNRTVKVQKTYKEWDGSKRTETDKAATQACQTRIGEIKDEFTEWAKGKMQSDVDMAEKMMRVYNDKFNSMVPKEVDDTFIPDHFEGSVDYIHLYPHQSKAVMRAVTEPVMLAHQVGAGKTFTLITTAMEMRRLGTAKKPMIVVQNATIGQFVAAAKTLYPNAKILSLSEKDRDAEGRRSFYGKIKYNDWDMIVIPQSTFERIPDSPERQQEFIQEKIDDKMHALEVARQAKADDRLIRQMERDLDDLVQERDDVALGREPSKGKKGKKKDEEKTKKNVAARAKEQLDRHADDVMYFDDMGIDALLIDEAHEYKRLGFSTTMGRGVKGIDPAGSKKAAGVYLKTRGILKSNGWKNVVFATGTPISNTAAEIWTFMRYLMPKEVLEENDIWYFDDFVHNFGKVAQSLEFATNGKFKENTRFAAYINKPELIRIWSTVADVFLTKDSPSVAEKLPERENGKDQDVFLPQTQSLVGIMRAVRRRLEEFEKMSGAEKRANSSIPLVMYGLAKRAAIDPRLVDAGAIDEPNSKTNKATDEIVKDLASTEAYKGTAAVFCDMQNGPEGFNIFQEMKRKLVEKGIPENQIAIITSGMTIPQKEKIFEQVNNGDIRVIMGSTQTLGTGVNIQERLHLLIHMDAPDRPMDYTQRNGRILRQGNLHKEWGLPIRILRFGVEDSLDVTSYQRLKTKSGFIDSVMDGKGALLNNQVDRTLEEEEEGLFDNPVAVLSGSQYALKKTQAERELRKWLSKRQQWESDQIYIENTIRRNNGQNKEAEERIKGYDKTIELAKKHFPDGQATTITIKGVETKNEEELQQALTEQVNKPVRERVDNYRKDFGFTKGTIKIPMKFDDVDVNVEVTIERETEYVQGKGIKTTMHTTFRYTIPALGLDEPSVERGFIKDIINDIREDITAQSFIDRREVALKGIEKRTADNEQLEARRSPTFKDEAKVAEAREKVAEYTEKMKEEMAAKEAKYAAVDAEDVDIDSIEENADEEEEQSADTGRRYDEDIEVGGSVEIANERFNNELEDFKNKKHKGLLHLGRPQAILRAANVDTKELTLSPTVLHRHLEKHGLTVDDLKGLAAAIQKPILVYNHGKKVPNKVVVTELDVNGGKLSITIKLDSDGHVTEIDNVRSIHSKEAEEELERLSEYSEEELKNALGWVEKEKVSDWLGIADLFRPMHTNNPKLVSVANILNNFENPNISTDFNTSDGRRYDEAATASQHSEHKGRIAEHVDALVERLGTKERTTVYHSFDELPEADKEYIRSRERQGRKVRGWYENGHIYLYLPHIDSKYQAEKTIWHETVAHHGLRELVGAENYDKLLRQLWLEHRDGEMGKWVTERMQQNGWNLNEAIDEYLAREAEKHPFEQPSLWQRLRWMLADALHKIGFASDPTISDIQYLFWASQNRLREGDALSVAKQQAFLHRLDRAAMQSPVNGRNNGERMYDEDIEEPLEHSAKAVYEDRLNRVETVFSEAYQDAMVSLKTAQNAIAKDKEIPDSQNAYMAENLMHGKNKNEQDLYNIEYRDPLIRTINKIMNVTGMNWGDVDRYVYTKSGLERNREFFVRDWLEAERSKTIRSYEDLNEEEQEIFDRKAASIEEQFEDGDIDEAEKEKRLRMALQEAHNEYLDDIESGWHRTKARAAQIGVDDYTFADYLSDLTRYIKENISDDYDPSEHDYSGFRAMFGDAEGKYDEADIIDELMDTEDRINENDESDDVSTTDVLWTRIRKATRYGLERYREAGMRSDEQIDEIESMFHFYVPMRGFKEDKGEDMYQYFTGKGRTKSYVGGLLKHAKGRGSEAEYPISTIFAMTYKAIADCNQNMVNQKLYRLCQSNPNDLIVLSDSWAVLNTETGQWEESGPDIPADATEEDVRQITLAWEDEMRRLSLEGKAKKITGRPRFDYVPLDKEKKSEHEIDVRINGKPRKMFVVGNPRMAQALNGQLRFEKGRNVFSKINAAIKNFMASLFTSYSPTFALRNMMRDWTHFRTMLGVREGEGYAKRANKYYRQSLFKMVGLFKKYRNGTLDESKEIERDFKDFMDNGGITGYVFMQKIDDIQKSMEKLYKDQKEGKIIRLNDNLWMKILHAVETLNEGIENNARFATFRASRHYAGRTKARSAYDAKEITVNFNRKGAGGKTAGFKSDKRVVEDAAKVFGVSSQILGEGRIFFNATVQAIATTFKNFQNPDGSLNKKYIAKWAGKYALPPFMFGLALPMINKMLAAALDGGDGDDDPYANLPEWTRRKNICLYVGDNWFITIPIGQELAAFLALGDIFAGNTYAPELKPVDRDLGDEMVDVMNTFSPVDISTKITKGGMMEDPISEVTGRTFSVLAPLVAVEQNLSWTGRPIYREDKFKNDKYVPEYQMVYSSTNPVMVSASQMLHELGGGNDRARGKEWSEVNPAIIQYLWEQYTGGPGKVFSNTISIGKDVKDYVSGKGSDFNIRKVEGIKAFFQQGDDRTQYYRAQSKFYKYQEDADKFKYDHDVSGLEKQAKTDPAAKLELDSLMKTPEYQRYAIIKEVNRSSKKEGKVGLDELRKEIYRIADRKEKRAKMQTYNHLMKEVVDLLDQVGKE